METIKIPLLQLSKSFESTATIIEKMQANPKCVDEEMQFLNSKFELDYSFINVFRMRIPEQVLSYCNNYKCLKQKHSVLILRDEGSNGDTEMCAYFKLSGFKVYNYNMKMLESNLEILNTVNGIAFVGGFTYSDIMGGATCWKANIQSNKIIYSKLIDFINNKRKFVIGVCNGFQLLIKLGIFGKSISLNENISGRFESRFIPIKMNSSNENIYFDDMEDTVFGMWCAHKYGRIHFDNNENNNFTPVLRYISSEYPCNPNGSLDDIAGICSSDGRILGLMPHFERSFINYQCSYIPEMYKQIKYTPWIYIAKNIIKFLNKF